MKRAGFISAAAATAAFTAAAASGKNQDAKPEWVDESDWHMSHVTLFYFKRYVVSFRATDGGRVTSLLVTTEVMPWHEMRGAAAELIKKRRDARAYRRLAAAMRGDWSDVGPNTVRATGYDVTPASFEELA